MRSNEHERFSKLTFEDFRRMAKDDSLSRYEKVGFPDSYREGKEILIFEDILSKLPLLRTYNKTVLDIGPGCSELPMMLIGLCQANNHCLLLVDSQEMLFHLPDKPFLRKYPARYPLCESLFTEFKGKTDVIVAYSVFHYAFVDTNPWAFLDRSLELLSDGGEMLIGDIPNVSKRKRFFSSQTGVKFHQEFTRSQGVPDIVFNKIEHDQIDDSVVLSLLGRARSAGFDAYLVPQREDLPMANRREDILIKKP